MKRHEFILSAAWALGCTLALLCAALYAALA